MMLTEICAELRNWFAADSGKYIGHFEIVGGDLSPCDFLENGQYFRVIGSRFNDGVYQYPANDLVDEEFDGAIWAMSVPPAFLALAAEIADWQTKNGEAVASPYQSESFGGYSYSKKSDSWQAAFAHRLNKWRKI